MDWNDVDLNDGYERDQNIIENLSFDTLLTEIYCNLPSRDAVSIRNQFEIDLEIRIDEAREIFEANLANIVEHVNSV